MAEILARSAEIITFHSAAKSSILNLKEGILVDISKDMSKRLKSCREKANLSQRRYAQKLGVAKSTLQKLEEGEPVSSQTFQHVADHLGLELILQSRLQQEDHVTVDGLIVRFLNDLSVCELSASKREGVETAMTAIRFLLEAKD